MAIEWMDNFSQYGTTESYMLNGLWAELLSDNGGTPSLETDPDGVSGGKVIKLYRGNIRRVLSAAKTTVGVGFRYYMTALPVSSALRPQIIQFADADNAVQVTLLVETTGAISVYRGLGQSGGTLLTTTATPVLVAGSWNHIEIKVLFSQTVGTVEVRINEEAVIALTNQDTVSTSLVECSQLRFCATSYNTSNYENGYLKDVLVWNTSGSQNNDFMGDCQIVTILPTSDDTFSGWASTGANGFSVIDETTPDDADYITAEVADTTAAVFALSNLDPDITVVKGLQTVVRALKTDGGTATLQVALNSAGDLDNGDDRPITTSATYWADISELDPDTAAAWTPTTVNAAKLSIDRTS